MTRATILVVDDEKTILAAVSRALKLEDFDVDVAGNATIAFEKIKTRAFDAVLLDVMMPDMNGLEMLRKLREQKFAAPVIVMSGHGTIDTALEATRLGAHDFIEKPISTDRLILSLSRALEFDKLEQENKELKAQTGALDALLGTSAAMRKLRDQIALAASAQAPVLVGGERGTGKELVARAIHLASKRAKGPLEKLNCAAVPSELIESELFGHETGAFTGATRQRRGKFERANGGTLFLDEVGDMPSNMQAKLLRVLQEGEIERVGGSDLIRVDVRVVAATNKSLTDEVGAGNFRADLYDRLNVVPLRVPPLRERREDIPQLASHFLEQACRVNDRRGKKLSSGAMELLTAYDYPGNVRELRNLIERLVILTPADVVEPAEARALLPLTGAVTTSTLFQPGRSFKEMSEDAEREILSRALEHFGGHMTRTAQELGLERSHLYKKMKALGLRTKPEEEG